MHSADSVVETVKNKKQAVACEGLAGANGGRRLLAAGGLLLAAGAQMAAELLPRALVAAVAVLLLVLRHGLGVVGAVLTVRTLLHGETLLLVNPCGFTDECGKNT